MPPVVCCKLVIRCPIIQARFIPVNSFVLPALHLQYVRNGVNPPDVSRVHFYGLSSNFFRPSIFVAFFQTERIHAERIPVAWHIFIVLRNNPGNTIAKIVCITKIEIPQMRGLQCQYVSGVVDQNRLQDIDVALVLSVVPRFNR